MGRGLEIPSTHTWVKGELEDLTFHWSAVPLVWELKPCSLVIRQLKHLKIVGTASLGVILLRRVVVRQRPLFFNDFPPTSKELAFDMHVNWDSDRIL